MSETCMTYSEKREEVTCSRLEFLKEDDQEMGTCFIAKSLLGFFFFFSIRNSICEG